MLSALVDSLVYFPDRELYGDPGEVGLAFTDLTIATSDGERLAGWWIPTRVRPACAHVLFFHGNAGNIADRLERAKILATRFGLDVFLVDYRGYGLSQGSPSEEGLYRDARAVSEAAVSAGFRGDQIVIFGESLGAAVAVDLARRRPCAGLVIEAPFLSIPEIARVHYPFVPAFFVRSRFDNLSKIADVAVPKLFLVPELDEVVPPEHGRRLFEAARGIRELSVVPGAHHSDAYVVAAEPYWKAWEKFLVALP